MSCVLHAFEALGEDEFHRLVLMPFMKERKAANRLTLACHQLRNLSQRATRKLSFTRTDCIPAPQHLHERFPSCDSVTLTVKDARDFSVTYPPSPGSSGTVRFLRDALLELRLVVVGSHFLIHVASLRFAVQIATSAVPASCLDGKP